MSSNQSHLHLLPWYVSGKIGQKERQEIDGHLRECEDCRAEVASLTSLMKSLQSEGPAKHADAADLVSYEEEPLSLGSDRRLTLELHLTECPECREDLATIQQARREDSAPPPLPSLARHPFSRLGWALTAASAAAVLILVAWPHRFGPSARSLPTGSVSRAVFPAPRRGTQAGLTLDGTGPWAIRVVLPFDARQGHYRVQVHRKDDGRSRLDITATTDVEQGIDVFLPALSGPGMYEMILTYESAGAEDPYLYSFELLAGSKPAN